MTFVKECEGELCADGDWPVYYLQNVLQNVLQLQRQAAYGRPRRYRVRIEIEVTEEGAHE